MKKSKKVISLLCATVLSLGSLAACTEGGGGLFGGSSDLQFWVYGDEDELEIYSLMTKEFNNTYGKDHNISVEVSTKPVGSYTTLIQSTASSKSGPDIFFVTDNEFKKWVSMGFLRTFDDEDFAKIEGLSLDSVPATAINRLRYDASTGTSTETSAMYGLPVDTKPTALYYNESLLKQAGITVISVDEKDMDAFNAGTLADKRGKKKSDYGLSFDVPTKGFYRSENPYTTDIGWTKPTSTEKMVFNNRIPMNWDEIEDLAMLFTPVYNSTASDDFGSDFGFFTEWWFSYGWSVGGDCLADLSGEGDWTLTLFDDSKNYLVQSEDGYVGENTGKTYKKGETLELVDKLDIPKGTVAKWRTDGGYDVNGQKVGIRSSVTEAKNSGVLSELPSQLEAMARYIRLGTKKETTIEGVAGLQLSPNPNNFGQRTAINYFYSGDLAMLVETSAYIKTLSIEAKARKFDWDIAPLPVYKQYADPLDPECDEVVSRGVVAGHSNSKGLVSRTKSERPDDVAAFMLWMAGPDGQKVRADNGHFPNQGNLVSEMKFAEYAPSNVAAFGEALEYQTPGDWWYLRSYSWIDIWANPLNSYIRNNVWNSDCPSYEAWKVNSIQDTHEELELNYKLK